MLSLSWLAITKLDPKNKFLDDQAREKGELAVGAMFAEFRLECRIAGFVYLLKRMFVAAVIGMNRSTLTTAQHIVQEAYLVAEQCSWA